MSISVSGESYTKLRELSDRTGRSLAQIVEGRLIVFLDRADLEARCDA